MLCIRVSGLSTITQVPRFTLTKQKMKSNTFSLNDHIKDFLEYIGEDPNRDGLVDTSLRVIKSWEELYSGYRWDDSQIKELLKTFEAPSDEMVVVKDIEFYSMCEHHILPFFGKAHVAYIPTHRVHGVGEGGSPKKFRVVGLSKIPRLAEVFARRLQIQERLGHEIVTALNKHVSHNVGCVLTAEHLCMRMRGVAKQNSIVTTSCMTGSFKEDSKTREEFLNLIKGV